MTLFDNVQTPAAGHPMLAAFQTPAPAFAPDAGAGTNAGPAYRGTVAAPVATAVEAGPALTIHVVGLPAPQGSKNAFVNPHTGRAGMTESSSKKLKPWRQDVKQAALDAIAATPGYAAAPAGVGVVLDITFLMPRPAGHYRTGRNAHLLRDGAPLRPTTRPDVDKLLRSTLDALKVAGVYLDDSHVVTVTGRKVFALVNTGAVIHVYAGTTDGDRRAADVLFED